MKRYLILVIAAVCLRAQDKTPAGKLPVKRVVLFKNGVGYFEHVGTVRNSESVTVSFTSGQLNDVLKSLTVLDLNGGRISGVAYGSSAPIDRQLGDLRLPIGEKATYSEMLRALRGTRIEVRSGGSVISGRLLSLETKTRMSQGVSSEVEYLSLMSETGEMRTIELSPASSIRLLEPGLSGKIDRYLDLVSSERDADVRKMVISTEGSGDRQLYVSYISEVPVWKSTYRLVLDSKAGKAPLLQGWAIVDNVVGEDWTNVELSLVAGAPQSFIQNLSQPYYSQRPVVGLPNTVSTTPQTYEATLSGGRAQLSGVITDSAGAAVAGALVKVFDASNNLIAQEFTDANGSYQIPSLPSGSVHLQVFANGFAVGEVNGLTVSEGTPLEQNARLQVGNLAQTVEVTAGAPTTAVNTESANIGSARMLGRGTSLGMPLMKREFAPGAGGGTGAGMYRVDDARAHAQSAALSQALGDLFEYKLKDPITILKNRSALVPIAQAAITAEKVSVWNERSGLPRPQRAVWITNTTGLTLDGGSVSVLEDETFTGEGLFDPIRPGEKRLLSYAMDLAVNASSRSGSEAQRVSRVIVRKGTLIQESETREKKTYTFRNEDTTARSIIVEHPVRPGYQLKGEAKPVETTADWMRFQVSVEPKQTATLVVEEAKPVEGQFAITNISSEQVSVWMNQRSIDPSIQSALQNVLAKKDAIAELVSQKDARDEETKGIFDDQQRLRENIKALKGTPEEKPLLERYTRQLNEQENRLDTLHKETAQLDAQIEAANGKLNEMIGDLAFDVKL
jgi:hypothetical protein